MEAVIRPLPISSLALEDSLNQLGQMLLASDKDNSATKQLCEIEDTSLIEAFLVEFLMDLKVDWSTCMYLQELMESGASSLELTKGYSNDQARSITSYAPLFGLVISNSKGKILKADRLKTTLYTIKNSFSELFNRLKYKSISSYHNVDVLFSTKYPNNTKILSPIAENVHFEKGRKCLYISNRADTLSIIKRESRLDVAYIPNYWLGKTSKDRVTQYLNLMAPQIIKKWRFTQAVVEKLLLKRLVRNFNISVSFYKQYTKCFAINKPEKVVLCTSASVDARMLILLSKLRGISNFVVMHGTTRESAIANLSLGDNHFVWSQWQADFIRRYILTGQFFVFGSPKHDNLLNNFRINPPKRVMPENYILFPTTPGNNILIDEIRYYEVLSDFLKASVTSGYQIILSPHRSDSIEGLKKIIADVVPDHQDFVHINTKHNTYDLLHHADIVFVLASTLGYESVLFNKKIIIYKFSEFEDWYSFVNESFVKHVSNVDEISDAIASYKSLPEFVIPIDKRQQYFFTDGQAIQNIVGEIIK